MTPRMLSRGGRKGIGRQVFPETAKETGRRLALTDTVTILNLVSSEDGGGDLEREWVPGEDVRGYIKPLRKFPSQAREQEPGGRVSEKTTHLVWLDPEVEVKTSDRVRIYDLDFLILGQETSTEGAFQRLEVMRA